MKLKKFFALALAAATLALALTACGSKAGDSADNSDCLLYTSPSPRDA